MQNRLKQLPLNVQKRVYEIAGMETGTICPDWGFGRIQPRHRSVLIRNSGRITRLP